MYVEARVPIDPRRRTDRVSESTTRSLGVGSVIASIARNVKTCAAHVRTAGNHAETMRRKKKLIKNAMFFNVDFSTINYYGESQRNNDSLAT